MLDIKFVKENSDVVCENMRRKNRKDLEIVDEVVRLDGEWRKLKYEEDSLRSERNKVSEAISAKKKKKENADAEMKRAKEIPGKIDAICEKRKKLEEKILKLQMKLPNIMSGKVPLGKSDAENVEERRVGSPKKFDFEVKSHVEILENLGMADFESSARVSGTGFYYLEDEVAMLNVALISYARDVMRSKGFRYVETPYLLRENIIDEVTDLGDKVAQIYLTNDEPKLALIGTSEHSLIGRFAGTEIDFAKLPIKQTSYSMCFRKEIGAHGIDEKGLFRTHQFNKIEMVVICEPDLKVSEKYWKEMQDITLEIFKNLGIPVRVLRICSGDLGDLKYEQVDIEAWSPRKNGWFEVGSCSNLTEAQARKLKIFTRVKGERVVPHTLNNTAIATSRALVAILENFQNKDGSVSVPEVLRSYMGGVKVISKKRN
ncbi:serine--tRNA ligase [Candidatus Pacearchaeota archaeon]|nr:serine--tRNA ligase [Candidatus Pacearchaeota archaeon]